MAEEYYHSVKAFRKGFIRFEESAHSMIIAEPDKVTREPIEIAGETLEYNEVMVWT